MKRGDIVTVALQGEQGKPRPALLVPSDMVAELAAVTLLPLTGTEVGTVIRHPDDTVMVSVNRALAMVLGLA